MCRVNNCKVVGNGLCTVSYTPPFHNLNLNSQKVFGEKSQNQSVSFKISNLLDDDVWVNMKFTKPKIQNLLQKKSGKSFSWAKFKF